MEEQVRNRRRIVMRNHYTAHCETVTHKYLLRQQWLSPVVCFAHNFTYSCIYYSKTSSLLFNNYLIYIITINTTQIALLRACRCLRCRVPYRRSASFARDLSTNNKSAVSKCCVKELFSFCCFCVVILHCVFVNNSKYFYYCYSSECSVSHQHIFFVHQLILGGIIDLNIYWDW
jgi:hypothetical protein